VVSSYPYLIPRYLPASGSHQHSTSQSASGQLTVFGAQYRARRCWRSVQVQFRVLFPHQVPFPLFSFATTPSLPCELPSSACGGCQGGLWVPCVISYSAITIRFTHSTLAIHPGPSIAHRGLTLERESISIPRILSLRVIFHICVVGHLSKSAFRRARRYPLGHSNLSRFGNPPPLSLVWLN